MPRDLGVLAARSICKSFGDTVVLDRISLTVTPGSKVGVVGPNGIGTPAGSEDAAVGGARLRPGPEEEKTKDIAKRFDKMLAQVERVEEAVGSLATRARARAGQAERRRRRSARRSSRRTRTVHPGPDRPRGSKRRPAGCARSKRRGQDDALASASRRAPAGDGPALDRTRRRPRRPPARRRSVLGERSLLDLFLEESGLEGGVARTLLAKFALGADHVLRPALSLSPGERAVRHSHSRPRA